MKVRFPPDSVSMTYEENNYQKLTYIMSPRGKYLNSQIVTIQETEF